MADRPMLLVVDDDAGMRETVRVILGPEYDYQFAGSAAAAEKCLVERGFDLVLLDLHMPGGSGLSLLPVIQRLRPDTQVIILTATGSYEAALEAIQFSVTGFLEKDFSPAVLQRAVEKAIERGRQVVLIDALKRQLTDTSHDIKHQLDRALESQDVALEEPGEADHDSFYRILAEVLESQDAMTAGHSLRVSRHAVAVGRQLGMDARSVRELEQVGYVHDIGKAGINKTVLNHEGRFSKLERVEIERHPGLGAELLNPIGLPVSIVEGVRQHHERLDGTGYPEGLSGREIGQYARIIAVVDSFDAMTWPRVYRPRPFRPQEALDILQRETDCYSRDVLDALEAALVLGSIETEVGRDPYVQKRRGRDESRPTPRQQSRVRIRRRSTRRRRARRPASRR